jgi:TfoX/Sxy family transcriptional regulator of competence genes
VASNFTSQVLGVNLARVIHLRGEKHHAPQIEEQVITSFKVQGSGFKARTSRIFAQDKL